MDDQFDAGGVVEDLKNDSNDNNIKNTEDAIENSSDKTEIDDLSIQQFDVSLENGNILDQKPNGKSKNIINSPEESNNVSNEDHFLTSTTGKYYYNPSGTYSIYHKPNGFVSEPIELSISITEPTVDRPKIYKNTPQNSPSVAYQELAIIKTSPTIQKINGETEISSQNKLDTPIYKVQIPTPSQRILDLAMPKGTLYRNTAPVSPRGQNSHRSSGPPSQRIFELSQPLQRYVGTPPAKTSTKRSPRKDRSRLDELSFLSPPRTPYEVQRPRKTAKTTPNSRMSSPTTPAGSRSSYTPSSIRSKKDQSIQKSERFSTPQHPTPDSKLSPSQSQSKKTKPTKEFEELINGPKVVKKSCSPPSKLRELSYRANEAEVNSNVDALIAGRKRKIEDPFMIAEVINELTSRRVEAMTESDYATSLKLRDITHNLRLTFRKADRENFHKEFVAEIEKRLEGAKDQLHKGEKMWAEREQSFKERCEDTIARLDKDFERRIRAVEEEWTKPSAARRYSKRSPQLLNQLTIEKNMAMIGDFESAIEMQKIARRTEAIESAARGAAMKEEFEWERRKVAMEHEDAFRKAKENIGLDSLKFAKKRDHAIAVLKRRVQIYEDFLAEECEFENFCAVKFKRPADVIVPMTVRDDAGDDIPFAVNTRAANCDSEKMSAYRANGSFAPLPLPDLRFKTMKTQTHSAEEKKHKKQDDF